MTRDSPSTVGVNRAPNIATLSVGVPVSVLRMQTSSPAEILIDAEPLAVVLKSDTVAASPVDEPFLNIVKMNEFPAPGAAVRLT